MSTVSAKQQEIVDRESRILELARRLVLKSGDEGLGLDVLATELNVSRGTIYNHFGCKEEILLALLVESMNKRRDMFQRAASYRAKPRMRLVAVCVAAELFARLHPDHFQVEQIVRLESVWGKTSHERRTLVQTCQLQCTGMIAGIVRDGVAQGHVSLAEGVTPESVVFGLWSLLEGSYSAIVTGDASRDFGITDPFLAVRENALRLLDGFQWEPLSTSGDYCSAMEEIAEDVFPEEFAGLSRSW